MRKILSNITIGIAVIFFLVYNNLIFHGSDGVSKDCLGLTVYEPPEWTSVIPYVGGVIENIYRIFSIHGLVGILVLLCLSGIGSLIQKLPKLKK